MRISVKLISFQHHMRFETLPSRHWIRASNFDDLKLRMPALGNLVSAQYCIFTSGWGKSTMTF